MHDHVYKTVEVTGSSGDSIEDAIKLAIARASAKIRHIRWFEVIGTRGVVEDDTVAWFQVTLKISFQLEEPASIPEVLKSLLSDVELVSERTPDGLIVPAARPAETEVPQ